MTPEEAKTVQRGIDAQSLLDNPTFINVTYGLMNHHHDAIALTNDTDAAKREEHFRKMRAYQDVLSELKTRAIEGDTIQQFYAAEAKEPGGEDQE